MEYSCIHLHPEKQPFNQPMRSHALSVVAFVAVALVACGPNEAEITAAKEKAAADSIAALSTIEKTYTVDVATSKVMWTSTMVGVYSHSGSANLAEGKLMTKGGMLTGGSFVIDMKSMIPLDSNYKAKDQTKENLVGHLSSPDFFAVDSFPTAVFNITGAEGNVASGDLTVRGKTNSEKVTDIVVTEENGMLKASGKLSFDRQKYGVAYKAAKDMVLNDAIELTVELTGTAQ